MSDQPPSEAKRDVCDGKDHGVTPERMQQLSAEADAFNRLLKVSEPGAQSPEHDAEAHQAAADFYRFLPSQPADTQFDETRAFDASKAFYEQLAHLPIGERRALAALAQQGNDPLTADDDAMPVLKVSMGPEAFISDLTVKYPWIQARDIVTHQMGWAKEYFTFHYLGMCAETQSSTNIPGDNRPLLSIDGWPGIPFLGMRRHR